MHFKNVLKCIHWGSHLHFTQESWYSGVHEVFTVFYVVDVFIIFQHIIQPLKMKKVVDAYITLSANAIDNNLICS